jgi:hypothetical protein
MKEQKGQNSHISASDTTLVGVDTSVLDEIVEEYGLSYLSLDGKDTIFNEFSEDEVLLICDGVQQTSRHILDDTCTREWIEEKVAVATIHR